MSTQNENEPTDADRFCLCDFMDALSGDDDEKGNAAGDLPAPRKARAMKARPPTTMASLLALPERLRPMLLPTVPMLLAKAAQGVDGEGDAAGGRRCRLAQASGKGWRERS